MVIIDVLLMRKYHTSHERFRILRRHVSLFQIQCAVNVRQVVKFVPYESDDNGKPDLRDMVCTMEAGSVLPLVRAG